MTSPNHAPEPQHESAPDDHPTTEFSAQPDSQPPTSVESSETGSKTDAGSIGLIVLVILAVIASLVMLISGSANALKIALLASLWAAVLGFFLVVRYRRQAHEAKELLAVERAHAASALTATGASTADNSQVLAEIRSELEAIRAQIEEISGREWVYEPAALYAEARRIQELERKAGGASVDEHGDATNVNFTQKSGGAPSADAVAGRLGSQPTQPVSNPLDNLLADNARSNTQQPAAKPAGKPADQQGTRPAPSPFGAPQPSQNRAPAFRPMGEPQQKPQAPQPQPQPKAEKPQVKAEKQQARTEQKPQQQKPQTQSQPKAPEFKTDSFQAVQWNQGAAGAQHVKEDTGPAQPHHRHRKPESDSAQPSTRGRRRSDEHREGAVSVAELLARRKQQQEPDKDVKK